MLELIGLATVTWVLWNVLKAVRAIVVKRRVESAVMHAERYGVPTKQAETILEDASHVKTIRRLLAAQSREFASKKAWEQLGETLIYIHRNDQSAEKWVNNLVEQVRADIAKKPAEESVGGSDRGPRT